MRQISTMVSNAPPADAADTDDWTENHPTCEWLAEKIRGDATVLGYVPVATVPAEYDLICIDVLLGAGAQLPDDAMQAFTERYGFDVGEVAVNIDEGARVRFVHRERKRERAEVMLNDDWAPD